MILCKSNFELLAKVMPLQKSDESILVIVAIKKKDLATKAKNHFYIEAAVYLLHNL